MEECGAGAFRLKTGSNTVDAIVFLYSKSDIYDTYCGRWKSLNETVTKIFVGFMDKVLQDVKFSCHYGLVCIIKTPPFQRHVNSPLRKTQ